MAWMAVLAPGNSASNGKSSAGEEVLPRAATGLVAVRGLPVVDIEAEEPALPVAAGVGFAAVGLAAAGFAAGFDPGFDFIGAPQNGQSSASSSMTDSPHAGQTGKSMIANSSLRYLSGGLLYLE
jgi:hypothetical protein